MGFLDYNNILNQLAQERSALKTRIKQLDRLREAALVALRGLGGRVPASAGAPSPRLDGDRVYVRSPEQRARMAAAQQKSWTERSRTGQAKKLRKLLTAAKRARGPK